MRSVSRKLLHSALNAHVSIEQFDYHCDTGALPVNLSNKFIQLSQDEGTNTFITNSRHKASNILLQLFYACMKLLLGLFLSSTSINGLLGRGKMFVFSDAQLLTLLSSHLRTPHPVLLDIGAGDGGVTAVLEGVVKPSVVYTTECSPTMKWLLKKRGYPVLDTQAWASNGVSYDIISCLNVLDRCSRPITLLSTMYERLQPGGLCVIALVLPYEPFIERGPFQGNPEEYLPVGVASWEESVSNLWYNQLHPMGFELLAVSRLPYLCEGDLSDELYSLDDLVMILRKPLQLHV